MLVANLGTQHPATIVLTVDARFAPYAIPQKEKLHRMDPPRTVVAESGSREVPE